LGLNDEGLQRDIIISMKALIFESQINHSHWSFLLCGDLYKRKLPHWYYY